MATDFRAARGRRLDWIDTSIEKYSNFLFIDQKYRSHPVLRRIFSLARKHGYRSLLVEEIAERDCSLLAEENEALARRCSDFQGSEVHRLLFLRARVGEEPGTEGFIGYAIFKMDRFSAAPEERVHVYEAVLPPYRTAEFNNFIHCRREYEVASSIGSLRVTGSLYAQQNGLTFVCAHVGLRSALSALLPAADISYGEMNRMIGVDHQSRALGGVGGGLKSIDIETILNGTGVANECIVSIPPNHTYPGEFQRDLYGAIESGGAAIVVFQPRNKSSCHLIPVIGHTFNDDTWVPDAECAYFGREAAYFSSESWVSTYVMHDDNFGPYHCLPRYYLGNDDFRALYALKPWPSQWTSVKAEAIALICVGLIVEEVPLLGQPWYDRFVQFHNKKRLVLRTFLVRKERYVAHLNALRTWDGLTLESSVVKHLTSALPDYFWIAEISAQELFASSRRKFGELLLFPDRELPKPINLSILAGARLPGIAMMHSSEGPRTIRTKLSGHTSLFSFSEYAEEPRDSRC